MSITDTTAPSQSARLSFDFELGHRPEQVWRALTEPLLLAQWLLPVVGFRPEPGVAFRFEAPAQPGWDGLVHCRVLEVEAERRLSCTWVVGDMDTVVTFTLTPTPSGTRLSLVQSGFRADQKRNFGGARYGWRSMGGRLVELLAQVP